MLRLGLKLPCGLFRLAALRFLLGALGLLLLIPCCTGLSVGCLALVFSLLLSLLSALRCLLLLVARCAGLGVGRFALLLGELFLLNLGL